MSTCHRCHRYFRVPEGEEGDHGCPYCNLMPEDTYMRESYPAWTDEEEEND